MKTTRLFVHLLDRGICFCLIVLMGALIYGHMDASGTGLNLADSYITEYMKKAPHWPWLIVASFSFALALFLMALSFLLRANGSLLIMAGCLLMAATSMGNFFVAYSPVRRVEQPAQPSYPWWTPTWWFTSTTAHGPYQEGMADAYSDVHYRATRLVVVAGVLAIFFIAAGVIHLPGGRSFGWISIGAVVVVAIFFQMGDKLGTMHGLWQRLGFLQMYAWFWCARYLCRKLSPGAAIK